MYYTHTLGKDFLCKKLRVLMVYFLSIAIRA